MATLFLQNCDFCKNFIDKSNYIIFNATGRKCKIRRDTSCNSNNSKNRCLCSIGYCIKCMKQGVGSSTSSTPHLSNHKSHVKKKKPVEYWSILLKTATIMGLINWDLP